MLKTPRFWYHPDWRSTVLSPFSALYGAVLTHKNAHAVPKQFAAFIVCVGNITTGGAGKTPVALYIGEWMKREQFTETFFVSRGYGGRLQGPVRVQAGHSAAEVGDEPLLLAGSLPCIVAKDRLQGIATAMQEGAGAVILDDGFQDARLCKEMHLLVVDAARGFGNGKLMPAGPLRESLATGPGARRCGCFAGARPATGATESGNPLASRECGSPEPQSVCRAKMLRLRGHCFSGKILYHACCLRGGNYLYP